MDNDNPLGSIDIDIFDDVDEGGDGNDGNDDGGGNGDGNHGNDDNNNRSGSTGGGQGGKDVRDIWYDTDDAKINGNDNDNDDDDDDNTEEEEKAEEGDKVQGTTNQITVNPQPGGKPLSFLRAANEPAPQANRMRTRSERGPPAPNRAQELKAQKLNHITNQELLHPKKFVNDPGLVSLAVYFIFVPKFDDEQQRFVLQGGHFRARTAAEGVWNGELHSDPIVFNCREEDLPPADYEMVIEDGREEWDAFYKATMRAEDENSFPDPPGGRWRRSRKLTGGAIMD